MPQNTSQNKTFLKNWSNLEQTWVSFPSGNLMEFKVSVRWHTCVTSSIDPRLERDSYRSYLLWWK